ncbi:MAG: glutamyl-tRNA reductase [Myxococcota bacterium]
MAPDERLIAVGISHNTAPLEVRERLAVSADAIPTLLARLRDDGFSNETVLLSTCNRVELYSVPGVRGDADRLARWLAETGGVMGREVESTIYRLHDQKALHHIFRVVSSLDSVVLGEPEIVGQFKTAYRLSKESNAAGPVMHRVMDRALAVAKKVRTETNIAREAVSVGRAGVELAKQVLGTLEGRSALLIGAGDHGKVVARSLVDYGLSEIVVANRTFENAVTLAQRFNGSAIPLHEVERYFSRVDVVICSTGAGKILIDREQLSGPVGKRRGRSLVMIDLAVPRNIDPAVNDLGGVYRFDLDDLAQIAGRGKEAREVAAEEAERIVESESERYWRQIMNEVVTQRIGTIVQSADAVRVGELERMRTTLDGLEPHQVAAVDAMTRAIVKKLLHQPLHQVRTWANEGEIESVESLFTAFGSGKDDDV